MKSKTIKIINKSQFHSGVLFFKSSVKKKEKKLRHFELHLSANKFITASLLYSKITLSGYRADWLLAIFCAARCIFFFIWCLIRNWSAYLSRRGLFSVPLFEINSIIRPADWGMFLIKTHCFYPHHYHANGFTIRIVPAQMQVLIFSSNRPKVRHLAAAPLFNPYHK